MQEKQERPEKTEQSDKAAKTRLLSLLSLSQKAGKLISGEELCERALQNGGAKLVIVTEDASDNTKKKFRNKTFFYKTPFYVIFTKEELNHAIGKQNRATVAVADGGFAKSMEEYLKTLQRMEP
jgi:ribosomal protein L7Ae-like RNA K-turn-binding protein